MSFQNLTYLISQRGGDEWSNDEDINEGSSASQIKRQRKAIARMAAPDGEYEDEDGDDNESKSGDEETDPSRPFKRPRKAVTFNHSPRS